MLRWRSSSRFNTRVLRTGEWLGVFLLFFLPEFVLYTTPRLPITHDLYFADLNSIYYTSRLVALGIPPEEVIEPDHWLPLPYYANALGLTVFGDEVKSIYKTSAMVSGLAGLGLFAILRNRLPRLVAWLALTALVFLTGKLSNIGYAAQYTATFAIWAVFFLLRFLDGQGPSRRWLAFCGLALGLAYCGKFEIASTIVVAIVLFLLLEPLFRASIAAADGSARPSQNTAYLVGTAALAAGSLLFFHALRRHFNGFVLVPPALVMAAALVRAAYHFRMGHLILRPGEMKSRAINLGILLCGFAAALAPWIWLTRERTGRSLGWVLGHYLPVFRMGELLEFGRAYTPHLNNDAPSVFLDLFAFDRTLLSLGFLGLAAALAWQALRPNPRGISEAGRRVLFDQRHVRRQRLTAAGITSLLWMAVWFFLRYARVVDVENKAIYLILPIVAVVLASPRGLGADRVLVCLAFLCSCSFAVLLRSLQHNIIYHWLFLPLALVFLMFAAARMHHDARLRLRSLLPTAALAAMISALGVFAFGHLRYQFDRRGLARNDFYSCYTTPQRDGEIRALQAYLAERLGPGEDLFVLSNNRSPYVLAPRAYLRLPSFLSYSVEEDHCSRQFVATRRPACVIAMAGAEDNTVSLARLRRVYPELVSLLQWAYPRQRSLGSFIAMEAHHAVRAAAATEDAGE